MKAIRKIIVSLFGIKGYIKLVSQSYLMMVRNGMLKRKYPELFFLKEMIQPGDVCIDIGANLGYYSTFMIKYAGVKGEVHAVEPIPLFAEVWKRNVKYSKYDNLYLHPFALGDEEKTVQMGIPVVDGVVHHGMTKVINGKTANIVDSFDVIMKVPDKLFSGLSRLDFVKCDVEGFESFVFSNFVETLTKFKPRVQSELSGKENREKVINLFKSLDYTVNILANNSLRELNESEYHAFNQDFYFLPKN